MRRVFIHFATLVAMFFAMRGIAVEIVVQSFEDGSKGGWTENREGWANGFISIANSTEAAADGTHSLKAVFQQNHRRWGAVRAGRLGSAGDWALQLGGTLKVDVVLPSPGSGVTEIGLALEQPDVSGSLNWQEVWFPTPPATNRFTVSLPFARTGSAAVNLHLGQTSAGAASMEMYIDNVRLAPNPPATKTFYLTRTAPIASFDVGLDGFGPATAGAKVENAGGRLMVTAPAGVRARVAQRLKIMDPGLLSEIADGGQLVADLSIGNAPGLQEVGIAFAQPDASDLQESWNHFTTNTATVAVVPFTRAGIGEAAIYIDATATTESVFYLDNFRFIIEEPVGGERGTLALEKTSAAAGALYSTGAPMVADAVAGPWHPIARLAEPLDLFVDFSGRQRFYREGDWVGILFDSETSDENQWGIQGTGWQAIDFGHSGTKGYGIAPNLTAGYPPALSSSLLSPVFQLSPTAPARLFYYEILDIGGDFENDIAEIFVRSSQGAPLPEAPDAIYQASERASTLSWQRREIDLPTAASLMGKSVRLEFRFRSDGFTSDPPQAGWFIDDVMVVLKP